ncbi:MAG: hypothetical protein FWE53_01295 [Firmicutes bacterium]|nr:hypothetical protein [Bacillota bacterium]
MKELKLTIDLLPKGAWGNNLSKTLPTKDWDTLREACYKRAGYKCEICGLSGELDAHEEWEFDVRLKTQTLKNIIALCSACHGVKHMRNSERIGYGENAKRHFIKVNNCSELDFARHRTKAQELFDERNKIYRWKLVVEPDKLGGKGIEMKERVIPFIQNPYEGIDLAKEEHEMFYSISQKKSIIEPSIRSVDVDNYTGNISVVAGFTNKIEWYLDGEKIKTKFNIAGQFLSEFSAESLNGKELQFKLVNESGETASKIFTLVKA